MDNNEIDIATEALMKDNLINEFANLQRIKNAVDKDKEIEYQEKVLIVQLKNFGFSKETIDSLKL